MIFIAKLQIEINQLVDLNSKFPNVIQPDKIENILNSWETIKANPESHEHTSSLDIFKRELKGCIAMLENQGSPHQRMDEGADINNLQARLNRISSTVIKRQPLHPMEEEPVLPATQPTPLSEQADSYAKHTAFSEQAATYGQIHPMDVGEILPATQPTRVSAVGIEPSRPMIQPFLKTQITQQQPFQMNIKTQDQSNEKEKEISLATSLKQKYELELRTMIDKGNLDNELMKEKSMIIKSLELLIMNLKL
ncbi:hypothetical protein STIUS_v1c02710 [Spiroplasma sp. TIUS-1]|uniref:hypothetical protein n=1 Tax=Spiroplasma sp. TIUS-1 TaxID=216963 RepID=UPI001398D245|nr:hypothetical protein [Spiroplasma sp. TIUS-1]QHX35825.1 hypothetical protein STIUS_v1c02710 [Spiroplasma sp. TIUS-1]